MSIFSTKAAQRNLWAIFFIVNQSVSAQIIISQYYEGNANDKFLEITNVSGSTLNPDNDPLYICLFSNQDAGNPLGKTPGLSTKIEVTLEPGATATYKNALAIAPVYATNEAIGALIGAFNGNDVIVISTTKDETTWENRIDVIGRDGDWGIDKSFYRKSSVNIPNPDYDAEEWTEISLVAVAEAAENEIERLGYHFYNCQKPTMAASNIGFSNTADTSFDISWNPGNGSSRLVIIKAGEAVSSVPLDGTTYLADQAFGVGDPFDGGFVVYNGWKNLCTITGLAPSTNYFVSIYEFDCSTPLYLTDSFITGNHTTLDPIPRIFTSLEENGQDLGLVKPNHSSAGFEITVSWINLSSEITARIDAPFEISPDNSNWFDQVAIPFMENGQVNLYLRFSPLKADGIHQGLLTLSATGADEVTRPVKATAFPNAWINELHYDDAGADEGEFVEVVMQYSENYDLSAFTLQLYNGNLGQVYQQESLDNFSPGEKVNNFMVYVWPVDDIQNGQPGGADGLALGIDDALIQFLSYEGTFTPNEGLANGISSVNINVEESDDTVEGLSLQLVDDNLISNNGPTPADYTDFIWASGLESPGLFNNNQVLAVDLIDFYAIQENGLALLFWQTLSEINNHGFDIQKSVDGYIFETIGFVPGMGTSNLVHHYYHTDSAFSRSCYYRLKQVDHDGTINFSHVIALKQTGSDFDQFLIFPNPTTLDLHITTLNPKKSRSINAQLLSIQGKKILQTRGDLVKIRNQINRCLKTLQSGTYVLAFKNGWHSEKHILLKE
ncbi:hypothetical protein QQ020_18815 [Fulvivirgaceae bacterium BMA12]|uniref:Secretion system C-terminal sorting domain-containing protein n=1 Tax=Agaribacillus aureus TaxID=3051825 RepID=A0ABT8LAN4_9BACT|nr:hypothetical protein [Fulvivirgaceae bacterium BMA12]